MQNLRTDQGKFINNNAVILVIGDSQQQAEKKWVFLSSITTDDEQQMKLVISKWKTDSDQISFFSTSGSHDSFL